MPLNTLRLNHQPSTHPNDRIVFIKPLPRRSSHQSDYSRAERTLKAIAAQCQPIMKTHHLAITTLEEHEPNPEFIGRNFNNGEVVQLVLRSRSGAWLPLHMVQMVMMHELAHNTHMNHGKGFWETRNRYVAEMKGFWGRGYTGDGLWGRGRSLEDATGLKGIGFVDARELEGLPLCGGTFRSRRKGKRKQGGKEQELTWKEKKERRIERKFGKGGLQLGEDEDQRMLLEISGKRALGGKPRVAQSKRGRELRAAAALARFGTNQREVEALRPAGTEDNGESTESEEYEEADAQEDDAKDGTGHKIVDRAGNGMIRVCAGVQDEAEVKNELDEINALADTPEQPGAENYHETRTVVKEHHDEEGLLTPSTITNEGTGDRDSSIQPANQAKQTPSSDSPESPPAVEECGAQICSICTTESDTLRLTCSVCAHVLNPSRDTRHWRCTDAACAGSLYINAGDCGICGLCGSSKAPTWRSEDLSTSRVLRADLTGQSGHIAYL